MRGLQSKLIVGAAALTGPIIIAIILFETISPKQNDIFERIAKELKMTEHSTRKTFEIDLHADHVERDKRWGTVAQELSNAQQAKKHFTMLENNLKKKLEELSEDVSSKGGDFVFTRFMSKGSVDYKAIPQLSGVDIDSYRKEGFARWKLTKI